MASASRARCCGVSICFATAVSAARPPAGVDVLDCFADALKVGTDAPGSARSIGAVRLIGRLVRLTTGLSGHLIPEVAQHLGRRRLTAQLLAQPSGAGEHG
jgi:hypothetical protein